MTVTQIVVPSTASAVGSPPTGIVWMSAVVGSIRVTVSSRLLVAQTYPAPIAIALGLTADADGFDGLPRCRIDENR